MSAALLAVLACTLAFATAAPRVAGRINPAVAVRLLVPSGLLIAAASTFALGVAAFTLVGQQPEIAEMGPWSPRTLRADTPIPAVAALVGGLLLAYAALSTLSLISRRSAALVAVHRTSGRLGAPGSVVVIESDTPDAFTTPEATGRIIVTRGMLAALTAPQQAAMLAHEASHLRHRHAWWLLAADVAAAINPTLRPTARALRQPVERWADEDAARAMSDRRVVAHALARAALAAHDHHGRSAALAATGGDVPVRVQALLGPVPRHRARSVAAVFACLGLLAMTASATLALRDDGERLFERAMNAHSGTHHTVVTAHHVDAAPVGRTR